MCAFYNKLTEYLSKKMLDSLRFVDYIVLRIKHMEGKTGMTRKRKERGPWGNAVISFLQDFFHAHPEKKITEVSMDAGFSRGFLSKLMTETDAKKVTFDVDMLDNIARALGMDGAIELLSLVQEKKTLLLSN